MIAGWLKQSFIDVSGSVSCVIFMQGCNLNCGYCHNQGCNFVKEINNDETLHENSQSCRSREKTVPHQSSHPCRPRECGDLGPDNRCQLRVLGSDPRIREDDKQGREQSYSHGVSFNEILNFIKKRENWLDFVVISGGEPCFNPFTKEILKELRKYSIKLKIDTNGFFPEKLIKWKEKKLYDSVSMDIKTGLFTDSYSEITGIDITEKQLKNLKESIEFLKSLKESQFRTTIIEGFHTIKDAENISKTVNGITNYTFQEFSPDLCYNLKWRNFKSPSEAFINRLKTPFIKNGIEVSVLNKK